MPATKPAYNAILPFLYPRPCHGHDIRPPICGDHS